ncbi:MAG: hypothetical protein WBM04_19585 [Candidatus Korobacteraceae bacterium]
MITAATASVYLEVFSDPIGELLYLTIVVAPFSLIAFMALFVRRWRHQRYTIAFALAVYLVTTAVGFFLLPQWRFDIRWFATARQYKPVLLSQPSPKNGFFRHAEWDGWGFPGAGDTTVYVVYDPSDSLLGVRRSDTNVSVAGLPCQVSRVKRLQESWYAVVFYTDSDWEHCPPNPWPYH